MFRPNGEAFQPFALMGNQDGDEGEKRRDKLRAWTKEELQGEDTSLVSSFLFTAQQQPPDSTHIWLHPCWYTPYMEDKPIALLAGA